MAKALYSFLGRNQMVKLLYSLMRVAMDLLTESVTRMSIDLTAWRYKKHIIHQVISTGAVLHLHFYSIINNPGLLGLLKKAVYTRRDTRAGWIGAGVPHTDSASFKPLADWATQHWTMYTGFLSYVKDNSDGSRILDVGCGLGSATVCLASILDTYTVTGIDVDDIAIRFAKRFNRRDNVRYIHRNFLTFRARQPYSYVFALEILEHIPPDLHYKFIDKCLSLLAKNGLLFITTPNALDEPDGTHAHIGLLNRIRARSFIERYNKRILKIFFYDNRELLSADPSKFEMHDPFDMFEDTGRNRSHFCFVMK
jgi:2-polyprenyl-3-methyl-5-hydroxy-6-metoxy-1,4-benzoquinol methylase